MEMLPDAVPGALLRALATAAGVALLLLAARAWGRRLAGLLTGLPTITAPALAWLAQSRGTPFAAEAAVGCTAAGAACALFGLGYAVASRRLRPAGALAVASGVSVLPVLGLGWCRPALGLAVLLSLAACAGCASLLSRHAPTAENRATGSRRQRDGAILLTAGVSGAVSGGVSMLAGDLSAFWCGMLASPPLIAAIVAMRLHVDGGCAAVGPFLHGYLGGLAGRSCFVAVFALLATPLGALPALACAGALLCAGLLALRSNGP